MERKSRPATQSEPLAHTNLSELAKVEKRAIPLAIVSAICLALPIFAPATFPTAWFGLVPFLVAINSSHWRTAFAVSLTFGLVFHGSVNYWLIPTIAELGPFTESPERGMIFWSVMAFVALLLWQSLFAVFFGLVARAVVKRQKGFVAALGVGSGWMLAEWLRSVGTFGYPWAILASTQVAFLPVAQWASLVGSFGLGGIIAFANTLLFEWLRCRHKGFLLFALTLLAILTLLGWVEMVRVEALSHKSPHLKVAAIQGNFGKERWRPDVTFAELEEILQTHLSLSERAANQGAQLIVWSETALPWRLREDGRWGYGAKEIQMLAEKRKVALLVGAGEWRSGKSYNACFVFAPKNMLATGEVYHKVRLVPFGEYVPGKDLFPWLTKILPHAPVETEPGKRWEMPVLSFSDSLIVKVATVICFESLFPFHLRKLVGTPFSQSQSANLVAIITNDSWFGDTLAPRHHARVAILRAIEMRRSVIRCAGTGISMLVYPTGEIVRFADWNRRSVIAASMPIVSTWSLYQVLGDLPFVAISLVALALSFARGKPKFE